MRQLLLLFTLMLILTNSCNVSGSQFATCKRTEFNYGKEVNKYAAEFNLPADYLKALIVLECSGKKDVSSRFEKHVYKRLKMLRDGRISRYERIRQKDIIDASDEALKNLARSWGPFQLMGYKCLQLGINVHDVRGEQSIYYGIKWINEDYGNYLRKGEFEQAFRIHNTGSPTGKTYDPDYVKKGLERIQFFGD
jgi:hypothetical protein